MHELLEWYIDIGGARGDNDSMGAALSLIL